MTQQDQTARLPNTSDQRVTLSEEAGEVVARLRNIAQSKFENNRSFGRRGKEWAIESEVEHQAADLLTRLSAERDRLEGQIRCLEAGHAESRQQFAEARDSLQANLHAALSSAERAEAERDALKAALLQIADGTWNHGRACANALTYRQFAKRAAELHATLSDKVS